MTVFKNEVGDDLPKLAGFNLVAAPLPEWGPIVLMVEFQGTIFVACSFRER